MSIVFQIGQENELQLFFSTEFTYSCQNFGAATSDECSKETAPRAYELVQSLKNMCQVKKPEVSPIQGRV